MLTEKGRQVLMNLYSNYSKFFAEENPGCNQNDVERGFLYACGEGVAIHTDDGVELTVDDCAKIEEIA